MGLGEAEVKLAKILSVIAKRRRVAEIMIFLSPTILIVFSGAITILT